MLVDAQNARDHAKASLTENEEALITERRQVWLIKINESFYDVFSESENYKSCVNEPKKNAAPRQSNDEQHEHHTQEPEVHQPIEKREVNKYHQLI